ncbi:unnamed protein product [Rhizophagus irregularis]|nr:unnamed protein product [Rhizophagus irregularis]
MIWIIIFSIKQIFLPTLPRKEILKVFSLNNYHISYIRDHACIVQYYFSHYFLVHVIGVKDLNHNKSSLAY